MVVQPGGFILVLINRDYHDSLACPGHSLFFLEAFAFF